MAMMNDASLCPLLEETKVGVSNYTKLPVTRLVAMGTAFQPLAPAVQTAVIGAGGSGLYYVNTAGKTMFQMKETGNFKRSLQQGKSLATQEQKKSASRCGSYRTIINYYEYENDMFLNCADGLHKLQDIPIDYKDC